MDEDSAAHSALTALSGRNIKGRIIKVEKSESKGKKRPSQKNFRRKTYPKEQPTMNYAPYSNLIAKF